MTKPKLSDKVAIFKGKKPLVSISEHETQKTIVEWTRLQIDPWAFAIPNGGYRNKTTAIKLKQEGVLAGIPDLFLPMPMGDFHGLFIEVKAVDGVLSEPQIKALNELSTRGYACAVAYGVDAGIAVLYAYTNGKFAES